MQEEAGTIYSLNEIHERFEKRDIELICTRTITAEIAICHGSDETGVRHDSGYQ